MVWCGMVDIDGVNAGLLGRKRKRGGGGGENGDAMSCSLNRGLLVGVGALAIS